MMKTHWFLIVIILLGMLLTVRFKKLTPAAAVTGGIISIGVFTGAAYTGIAMMAMFFLLGVLATSWKIDTKQRNGLAETNKGKRKAGQVLANAGVAAIIGVLLKLHFLDRLAAPVMIGACFAAAAADTISSELGNVYGSRYYNVLTLQKDEKGLNGVISIEGTLLGLAGSVVIALVYAFGYGFTKQLCIIIIAGTAGNLMDSVLGASLERRRYINNDVVNFLNNVFAALIAFLMYSISN